MKGANKIDMDKLMKKSFISITAIVLITIGIGSVEGLLWWIFLIPVGLLGVGAKIFNYKVPPFLVGFIAGVIVWSGLNAYYHWLYKGHLLDKIGHFLNLGAWIVVVISGILGGIVTGLAFYTGYYSLHTVDDIPSLKAHKG